MSQLLIVEGISKEFPGVKALDGVFFELDRGEVFALGENGAGKSTLMKILSGIYGPDGGRTLIMDEPTSAISIQETQVLFRLIRSLRDRGVGIVYISHRIEELRQIADHVTVLRRPTGAHTGVGGASCAC